MPPTPRQVAIRLDKTRHLVYNFRAFRRYQKATGRSISQGAINAGGFGVDELAEILWAGLITEDPNLDIEAVDELMDQADGECFMDQFSYVNEKVSEALAEMFSEDAKKKLREEKAKATTASGTGKRLNKQPTDSSG